MRGCPLDNHRGCGEFRRKNRLFALMLVREWESDFLDPRRFGLMEDRFRRPLRLSRRPASLIVTEQSFRAATGSNGRPDERGQAKIEHVVESRFRLLLIFRH